MFRVAATARSGRAVDLLENLRSPGSACDYASIGTGGSVVTVTNRISSSRRRYHSHIFRPATRRTHARPTGRTVASKSAGPGNSLASVSVRTVRATATARGEPGRSDRPASRAYHVVTRTLRATTYRLALRASAVNTTKSQATAAVRRPRPKRLRIRRPRHPGVVAIRWWHAGSRRRAPCDQRTAFRRERPIRARGSRIAEPSALPKVDGSSGHLMPRGECSETSVTVAGSTVSPVVSSVASAH